MYSTRTTPRPLKLNSIETLPLTEIASTYGALMSSSIEDWENSRDNYRQILEAKFIKDYNATHEDSYEGDFDALGFDEQVNERYGSSCAELGSTQQVELDAYLAAFSTQYAIKKNSEWVFEQMLAKFAEVTLVRNEDGTINPIGVFKEIRKSPFTSGCLVLALQNSKSGFLGTQTDPKFRNYCALVPLVLAAFKKYRNVPYSMWSKVGLHKLVAPNLYAAMMMEELPDVTREEVIELRKLALTPKSGVKMGQMANPATTYRLYMPAGSALAGVPQLGQIMLCQTWCAHPTNRTEYMILNPLKWDDMPEDLISGSVIRKSSARSANLSASEW